MPPPKVSVAPNQVWLTIFLPALVYYTFYSPATTPILSYLNLLPSYTPLNTTVILERGTKEELVKIFYDKSVFETVIQDESASFNDMTWVEDVELGRGYLLLSDSASSGKVWRYETGGGIVPIGKSLFLDQSGCRSNHWNPCETVVDGGSKGLALQVLKDEDRFDIGRLIVVENGEERIVRLEEDGARTPLVLNVPSPCGTGASGRLNHPDKVVYTPFGDLLFVDSSYCRDDPEADAMRKSAIYRVKEVVNIPSIVFHQSRHAHTWTIDELIKHKSGAQGSIEMAYNGMESISDIIVGKDVTSLFVSGNVSREGQGCRKLIIKLTDDTDATRTQNLHEMPIFYDMTSFYPIAQCIDGGIAMAINSDGVLFASFPGGLAIIDPEGDLLGTVKVSMNNVAGEGVDILPNALVIGNDGYLYMTTKKILLRLKIRSKLLDHPTNLLVPKKK